MWHDTSPDASSLDIRATGRRTTIGFRVDDDSVVVLLHMMLIPSTVVMPTAM